MNRMRELFMGAKSGWNNMDKNRRVSLMVILICVILFTGLISFFTYRVKYTTLFTNLELGDAGVIVEDLTAKNIDYKLENGGKDILIDDRFVDNYRIEIAMNGMMPENSTGFEIFDNMGLMVTDEDRKIMYQRALTGELQRSIMSIESINAAKVHLVMAQKTIFDTEEKEATASVILDVKPEYKVSNDTIKGITALVSAAVENLPKSNVQVIDSKGNLLSSNVDEEDSLNSIDVIDAYEEIRTNFETKLENNINELLGTAYGRDKVKVSVYADMDFDSRENTIITYENPVVRSEELSIDGGNLNINQGDLINDNTTNVGVGTNGDATSYDRTVNNELTTETITTVKAPGEVIKLTSSVVYDGTLSQEDEASIRNIVSTVTGYDANRGDVISVEGVVFDKTYEEELQKELDSIKAEEEANRSILEKYGEYLVFGLLSLLGLIILISLLRLLFGKRRPKENLALQQLAMETPVGGNVNMTDDTVVEKLELKQNTNETKVKEYAAEHPDVTADLLKAWLKD